jgi:molybdopterin converting factor small subunit
MFVKVQLPFIAEKIELDVPEDTTVKKLVEKIIAVIEDKYKEALIDDAGQLKLIPIVNGKYSTPETKLNDGDEIFLFFPIVAG